MRKTNRILSPTHAGGLAFAAALLVAGAGEVSAQASLQDGGNAALQNPGPRRQVVQKKVVRGKTGAPEVKTTKVDKPPTAGIFPFIPPYFVALEGGGALSVDTRGIIIKTDDNAARFRIGGRFQEDVSTASLRPLRIGPALSDNEAIRRAYVESYLTLGDAVEVAFQYDFNSPATKIQDAVLAYRGYKPFIFSLGNFKEPFSHGQLQSDNNTLFTERSLLDTFAPGRNFGAAVGYAGENWTAVGGVFGGNANTGIESNGVSGTARVTYAPILTKEELLHFGVAGTFRSLDINGSAPSFSARPEDFLFNRALVATGALRNADSIGRVGLESIYQLGSVRVEAEYALTDVMGRNGQDDRVFQAGYIQTGWVINGSGRTYRLAPNYGSEFAVLTGVEVPDAQRVSNGGIGVFEVGARLSAITLKDGVTRGGTQYDGSLGLNWYPDRNIKLMADYVRAHADPAAQAVNKGKNADADIFVGRIQLYW